MVLLDGWSRLPEPRVELRQDPLPVFFKRLGQLPVAYGGTFGPGQDHEVDRWPGAGKTPAETFPYHALEPVATHRTFVDLARDGQAKARSLAIAPARQNLEAAIT